MNKIYLLLLSLSLSACLHAQVLPAAYQTDWSLAANNPSGINAPYDSVSILNFGGNNSGTVSNDAALTAAISSLSSSSNLKVIFFPSGNYLFNSTINLSDNIILQGAGATNTTLRFDFNGAGADLIRATGAMGTDSTAILGSGIKNTYKVRVNDESKFAVGDYIRIIETDNDLMFSTWAYGTLGQFAEVMAISGDSITLSSPLRITYPETRNPYIQKVNFVENVGISCMKIVRADAATASGQYRNIRFNYTANSWISGVHSDSTYFAHVDFLNSYKNTLKQSFLENSYEYGGGGRGYGVVCQSSSSECLIINNIFRMLRHSMLLQSGANGNVFSYNYSREPFWIQGFFPNDVAGDAVLHGNYPFSNLFEHNIVQNIVVDNSHAENGPHNLFFRNQADNAGIFMNSGAGDSTAFVGNEVTAAPSLFYGLYVLTGTGNFTYGNNVNGTPQPSGTTSLPDNSYYTTSAPSFISGTWPSIGYPNTINSGSIPAETRYASNEFALCDSLKPFVPLFITNIYLRNIRYDKHTELQWSFEKEFGQVSFSIMKSIDGINFFTIGTKQAEDNKRFLTWEDDLSNEKLVYYQVIGRLNGDAHTESNTIVVKGLDPQVNPIEIYPNPVTNNTTFQLYSENSHSIKIELINSLGKSLFYNYVNLNPGSNELPIDFTTYPAGLYFLKVTSEYDVITKKIIKE